MYIMQQKSTKWSKKSTKKSFWWEKKLTMRDIWNKKWTVTANSTWVMQVKANDFVDINTGTSWYIEFPNSKWLHYTITEEQVQKFFQFIKEKAFYQQLWPQIVMNKFKDIIWYDK